MPTLQINVTYRHVVTMLASFLTGPCIPAPVTQDTELHLGALLTQMFEAGTTEHFGMVLQSVLQGLDVTQAWRSDLQVGIFFCYRPEVVVIPGEREDCLKSCVTSKRKQIWLT